MPRISKKFRNKILNAVSEEVLGLYETYCPEIHVDGEPENWSAETRRIFDMLTDAESRINRKLEGILNANIKS